MSEAEITGKTWDVIIIGAGMGGGIAGRKLAERGLSVLFVDRGPSGFRREQQSFSMDCDDPTAREIRGYWPTRLNATIDGSENAFFGAQGTGIGGTSVFYAATLERPERHDFEATADMPHPTGGWPIGFDAFQPWYEEAERLLDVCGEPDPLSGRPAPRLRTPPPLSQSDQALLGKLRRVGMHPYRMHLGIRYIDGCLECIGRKCPNVCKMDGRSAGVEPALATGRAVVLDSAEVTAVRGAGGRVTHVDVIRNGRTLALQARIFVLAAGAFASPGLLLRSAGEAAPNGFANSSGLVGANLMFHLNERIAIWSEKGADTTGPAKTLALRDFYRLGKDRFGLFQAMGLPASYGNIVQYLNDRYDRSLLKDIRVLKEFTRIPALVAARVLGEAHIYAAILEDLPYAANRVVVDPRAPHATTFIYDFAPELLARRKAYRRLIKKRLAGLRSMFLNFEPELNIGHPCGTLVFSKDPKLGVLDADCRTHDAHNLYVADSSFMPTSTGVNPSLTIAANALRVADAIVRSMR